MVRCTSFFLSFDFSIPLNAFPATMKKPTSAVVLRHLTFWVVVFFFEVSRSRFSFVNYTWESFRQDFMETLLNMPILMAASYVTGWYLIPVFFRTGRYGAFVALFICSALSFIFIMRAVLFLLVLPVWYPGYLKAFPSFFHFNIFQHFFYIYSVVLFMVLMKTIGEYAAVVGRKEQLERENAESRLSLLRSQVNPHFLFNTLNNISALARINAEATSDALQRLSEIMRYMMHDASEAWVPMDKEIGFIRDYIRLQELRMPGPGSIELKITGHGTPLNIPPMMMIPFIENAFKHGRKDAGPPAVTIGIMIRPSKVTLQVMNWKKQGHTRLEADHSGIGTENVKKRLQLLLPGRHDLSITEHDEQYKVTLIMEPDGSH
jgi:sensor histidine kinase YesM